LIPSVARSVLLSVTLWLAAMGLARAEDATATKPASADPRQQVLVLLRLPPEHFRPNADYGGGYGDELGRSARRRIASRLAQAHGLTLVNDWAMPLAGVDCYIMSVPTGQSAEQAAGLLSREPGVAWSEPVRLYQAQSGQVQGGSAKHDDPLFPVQPAALEWRLAELHEIATGRNVRVAVIDSMIERTHPDLIGQIELSENFVPERSEAPERHGTGVAGVIAARGGNGVGIIGVAPHARLLALRACWQESAADASATICDSLSLAKALHFAIAHDAQVINLSLSGPPDPLLSRLLDVALTRGVTVVGAFDRKLPGGGFPASHAGVVAVVDEAPGAPIPGVFSAPGRDVPTTQPGGRWFLVNGSSYAAAHVSGLFALLREKAPSRRGASALVAAQPGGVIDTCATLLRALGPCECGCARPRELSAALRQ
jgi:subtilisin family serine protease